MTAKARVIEAVGADAYSAACRAVSAALLDPSLSTDTDAAFDSDIPHEISDHIWEPADLTASDRVRLLFEIYDEMPCYAHLMYAKTAYPDLDAAARQIFWESVRSRLANAEDPRREHVKYSLWCDFLEDPKTVNAAWTELVSPDAPRPVLAAALECSGPVPFVLKDSLYERLISDPTWHPLIFQSLRESAFEYFGDIDRPRARAWLRRLQLPPDTQNLENLRSELAENRAERELAPDGASPRR